MHVVAEFRVKDKAEADQSLESAVVTALSDPAYHGTHGGHVTRHNFDHFTVALSPHVPLGLVQEHGIAPRA